MDQDLPNQSPALQSVASDVRSDIATMGTNDLFFFAKTIMGYKDITPRCHGPITTFVTDNPSQFKLILIPRDHFKTSVVTIAGTTQRVCRNPNTRNLIANESAHNAERMLRAIRQHAESNSIFRTIYSHIIPTDTRKSGLRWNDHELDFNRDVVVPEPTIDTVGMTGAFVGRHYTDITCDDLISEEAVKSPKVMEDTIQRFKGFFSLLVRPNTDKITIVGTRWALHDIYSWITKNLGPRLSVYATGVYDAEGEPIFPALMSKETLELKRASMGEYKFSCLYLNNPRNEDIQDLNIQHIRSARWANAEQTVIELLNEDSVCETVPVDKLDITCTVDLAPAESTNSDMNAVTTVGTTPRGAMVVLDSWGRRCKPADVMEHIFAMHRRWHPRVFGIEGVAYQKAFKYFLQDECERRQVYINVRDLKAIGRKEYRIRGIQPIMAAGRFYMLGGHVLLRNQMAEFPLGEHDDVIDSLSMHLQIMIGQLSPETIAARQAGVERAVSQIVNQDVNHSDLLWAEMNQVRESGGYIIP